MENYKCHKCGREYSSKFWFDAHLNHKHNKKILLSEITAAIVFVYWIINTPLLSEYSIYDTYFIGPKISIEILYPAVDNQLTVNYKNIGRLPLNNIYITYSPGLDKSIFPSAKYYPIFIANLTTHYLGIEESDKFIIDLNIIPNKSADCSLIEKSPKIIIFNNTCDNGCYYKTYPEIFKNTCIPLQINITFSSKEIPDGVNILQFFPVSDPHFGLFIGKDEIICVQYKDVEDKCLVEIGRGNLIGWDTSIGNLFKLSKKLCGDGKMPIKWCVENIDY